MNNPWAMPVEELVERFRAVHTPAVCDVLDAHDRRDQVLPPEIAGLTREMKVAGPAFTALGVATRHFDESQVRFAFEGWAGALEIPSRIAVIQASGDRSAAHWGELISISVTALGFGGAVVDGGVRDVERILPTGFPVFCRYATPADIRGRWRYVDFGIPVRIGDVTVRPWDVVVGDANGVVVVPYEIAEDVLHGAEEILARESRIRADLAAGVDPLTAYLRHGGF